MTGKISKLLIILIAIADGLALNILTHGTPEFEIAVRVMMFFLTLIPFLVVGSLLKYLCCCKK